MFFGGVNSCSTRNLECVLGYKLYQLLVKLKEIIKEMILILELQVSNTFTVCCIEWGAWYNAVIENIQTYWKFPHNSKIMQLTLTSILFLVFKFLWKFISLFLSFDKKNSHQIVQILDVTKSMCRYEELYSSEVKDLFLNILL